jgi:hypothetical protein
LIVSGYSRENGTTIRLRPLAALARTARSLKIRWAFDEERHHEDATPMLDAIVHLDEHPVLRDYVERSADRVEVHNALGVDSTMVAFFINEDAWEDWMGDWLHRYYAGEDEGFVSLCDWVDRVKLPYGGNHMMILRLRFARA